jgi:hypothetical protein
MMNEESFGWNMTWPSATIDEITAVLVSCQKKRDWFLDHPVRVSRC